MSLAFPKVEVCGRDPQKSLVRLNTVLRDAKATKTEKEETPAPLHFFLDQGIIIGRLQQQQRGLI
jgi:hypothetical protein